MQGCWNTPAIPALRMQWQEDYELEVGLRYILRLCYKKKQKKLERQKIYLTFS